MGKGDASNILGSILQNIVHLLSSNELLAFPTSHTLAAKHQNRHDLTRGQTCKTFIIVYIPVWN